MTKRNDTDILQYEHPTLRGVASAVRIDEIRGKKIVDIIKKMSESLEKESDGVAIAAPQIGAPYRIFIVSKRAFLIEEKDGQENEVFESKNDMVVINPEIIKLSKKKAKVAEGCLSVRWLYGNTERHEKALIRGYDENGKVFTYGGSGLIAQIFQHEIDHLNGILFIDHATDIEELTPEEITKVKEYGKKQQKRV